MVTPHTLEEVLARHIAFTFRAFGPGARLKGTLNHIRKELVEVEADPFDPVEWVDLILLAINGAARHGHDAQAIAAAIVGKIATNEARTWPDWRTSDPEKAIEHVRAGDPAPVNAPETQAMESPCKT